MEDNRNGDLSPLIFLTKEEVANGCTFHSNVNCCYN